MLNRIKAFFSGGEDRGKSSPREDRLIAAACLMVEAARLDSTFDEAERSAVLNLLSGRFGLRSDEAASLLALAEQRQDESSDLYSFTRAIKEGFPPSDRVALVEMLWEIAYADGHADDFETSLIRRVAGLLYVTDYESGEARKRTLQRAATAFEG